MEHRLREGKGSAFYYIGLEDNGNPIGINQEAMFYSLYFLNEMANKLEVELVILDFLKGINGIIAHISIKQRTGDERTYSNDFMDYIKPEECLFDCF